ncbi:MAG TPA: glycosyltransferase, partial [Patescibacteria group bacterium]|nr:glycosyltransferase [Patescibacteria group bacterium]
VAFFLRKYDNHSAQKVNFFIANSKEVAKRISKFYRRDSTVIYPPVEVDPIGRVQKEDYYFILSRMVGGKGLDLAVKTAVKMGLKLKIAGRPAGYFFEYKKLQGLAGKGIEFLGYVTDEERTKLYAGAKAFLALSTDEDFGITLVEAMMTGTPVIAYKGGGYLESVVEGKTGIFFDEPTVEGLAAAIRKFDKMTFLRDDCINHAKKFSKERFKKEIREFVNNHA